MSAEFGLHADSVSEKSIEARGWVNYQVAGEKPAIFKNAPPVVLDSTIKMIEFAVSDFTTREFSLRLLKSFRAYAGNEMRKMFNQ